MLTTKVFVVDNFSWMDNCRFQFLWNTKIVQIWHGIGFKKIQRNNKFFIEKTSSLYRRFILNFVGKLPNYDVLISTGRFFTEEFFKPAFIAKHFLDTGYPRNDIILNPKKYKNTLIKADVNCIAEITKLRHKGVKSVLYAPTFRDTGGDAISDGILDLERLNNFAKKNNFVFVFKLHPLPQYKSLNKAFDRLLWYDNVLDVYPLLSITDLMISDYSSIYMDYLLLKRPVLFLLYDREKYETKDRELHDYFNDFLIGDISTNQDKLEDDLLKALFEDTYSSQRDKILKLSYKYKDDNASARIFSFIEENYLSN